MHALTVVLARTLKQSWQFTLLNYPHLFLDACSGLWLPLTARSIIV